RFGQQANSKFLIQFAGGRIEIRFSAVEMSSGARSPTPWRLILCQRTALEKKLIPRVEDKNVRRAMTQFARVNLAAGGATNHVIRLVDHIENLRIGVLSGRQRGKKIRQSDPFLERERLGASGLVHPDRRGELWPVQCSKFVLQQLAQLLPPLRESRA